MTPARKILFWTGFVVYGLLLFLLLTLYRLQADKVLGKALTLFTETGPRISAETVSFSLPFSYTLKKVTCVAHWPQGVSEDLMDSLVFGLEWQRIFSGALPIKSAGTIGHGRVEARLGVPVLSRGYLDAKSSGIHLEDLSFLEVLLDRHVSGRCEGELRLVGDVRSPAGLNGRGFLQVTDGFLESKLPLAGLSTFPFQSISTFLIIEKGLLFLKDGKIAGAAVSGAFSGVLKLNDRLSESLLELSAQLTPGPLLDENELARPFLTSLSPDGEPITIHLGGSLGRPSIRWGKD